MAPLSGTSVLDKCLYFVALYRRGARCGFRSLDYFVNDEGNHVKVGSDIDLSVHRPLATVQCRPDVSGIRHLHPSVPPLSGSNY